MAQDSEKLGYKDFFDDALFTPVIENVNTLIASLQGLRDTIKAGVVPSLNELKTAISAFTDAQKAGATQARQVAEAVVKVSTVSKAYAKIQENINKLTEKKAALESEEAKRLALLRFEVKEAERDLKLYAQATTASARAAEALEIAEKALKGQIDANIISYSHLSDALEDLRERYKSLVMAGQANTEEASRLRDAIVQLDARIKETDARVGQFQRNVGNYTKSFKEAMTEFLGASGPAGEAILGLTFAAERAKDAFVAAGGGVKGFFRAIVEGAKALRGVGIMLLLEGISKLLSIGKDMEALEIAEQKLGFVREEIKLNNDLAGIKLRLMMVDEETMKGLIEKEKLLKEQIDKEIQLNRIKIREAEAELKRAYEDLNKSVESPINKILTYLGKALGGIVRMLAYIPRGLAEVLKALKAEDAAKALFTIASKAEEAAAGIEKVFASFGAADQAQAKEKIASIEQNINDLINQENELHQQRKKIAEDFAKLRKKMLDEAMQALELEVEATGTARQKLKAEYEKKLKDYEEVFNEQKKKLEGQADAIKAITEKFQHNVDLLRAEWARKDAELLQEATKRVDEIRQKLSRDALAIDIAEINAQYDALRKQLLDAAEEAEQDVTNLLATLEERRQQAIQKAILESADRELRLREDIAIARLDAERLNFKREEDFNRYKEKRLAEIQIEGAKQRLDILRKLYATTGDETIQLEIARTEAIIAQMTAKLKDMAVKTQQEIISEYIKAIETISDALSNYLSKIEEKQISGLQRQQNYLRSRIAVYEGLAKEGALAADQSIAELEAREDELIRRQEELKKKAQRREMALAAIKTYVQLLDRNAPSPLAQTIRDITVISQFVSRLPTFFYGTEYVRDGIRIPNVVRDALIVRVHEGERIVPADINRQLGNIKNEDLPKIVNTANTTARVEFDYDSLSNTIVTSINEGNKKKIIRRRL